VIDRLEINDSQKQRFMQSLNTAMKQGKGSVMVLIHISEEDKTGKQQKVVKTKTTAKENKAKNEARFFSRLLMCPTSGISYDEPQPNLFSFNSPYGACTHCNGLGVVSEIDIDKIVPHKNKSIKKGALVPLGEYKSSWIFRQIEALGQHFNFNIDTPFDELDEEAINAILYGTEEILKVKVDNNNDATYNASFDGIVNFIVKQNEETTSPAMLRWVQGFMNKITCPVCNGARLKKEALYFKIDKKNISEVSEFDVSELHVWCDNLEKRLSDKQNIIAKEILKEIRSRISFLLDVGLDYVSLNRSSRSLSGGEAQRIRLATQIGSQLVGVLYILDEPSIGLHQRDNTRLINSLKNLRDVGNSVLVVEHDKEMIESSDYVIDIGPGAGVHGGQIVAACHPKDLKKTNSITSQYFSGKRSIEIPKIRRKGNGKTLSLIGAKGNNLKNVSVHLPLGTFICVTGVSGSGKSTLINETLYPILSNYIYKSETRPLVYKEIKGIENIDKIIEIDQSPIGRTPRSNPATYTKLFDDIRNLFAIVPEAQIRGYKAGRFSFNVKGGRCETCQGGGMRVIEMNFLPDVYVQCETCSGKRYNRETLEVRYKGKSISDVLDMTIEQATVFFENIPWIHNRVKTLKDVGLGYITLGQQATTLSGGEAQRVKLATELSKRGTGNTFYILDEPTTGLHFEDVKILLEVLQKLVEAGNTVLVIEHNLDIIKTADYIIDMGPEGGKKGGTIICEGTPEQIIKNKESHTAIYLKKELEIK
jgi:excinuclease ABC subunit A